MGHAKYSLTLQFVQTTLMGYSTGRTNVFPNYRAEHAFFHMAVL